MKKRISMLLVVSLLGFMAGYSQEIVYSGAEEGSYDIWAINADGSGKANLSRVSHDPGNQYNEVGPFWSPDGSKISFKSNRSGVENIWIMDADGNNDFNLTNGSSPESWGTWSNDGKKVYFSRRCGGNIYDWELFVIDVQTKVTSQLTVNSYYDAGPIPDPSPGSEKLVFTRAESPYANYYPSDNYIFDLNAQTSQYLFGEAGIYEAAIDWSKATNKILFCKDITHQIGLFDYADGTTFMVTEDGYTNTPFCFSPDGETILFGSNRSDNWDLWTININQSGLTQLTVDGVWPNASDWKSPTPLEILAVIDIKPDTLNLESKGKFVTAYIQLSQPYDVSQIQLDTLVLKYEDKSVSAIRGDVEDSLFEAKFSRKETIEMLRGLEGNVTLMVSGYVDGIPFTGEDTIRVIN